jgi:hypothetical protein
MPSILKLHVYVVMSRSRFTWSVPMYVERILRKLDFSSRTQVASWVASGTGHPAGGGQASG